MLGKPSRMAKEGVKSGEYHSLSHAVVSVHCLEDIFFHNGSLCCLYCHYRDIANGSGQCRQSVIAIVMLSLEQLGFFAFKR